MKIKILFIESGTTGGGSFESLYQHIKIIDLNKYEPYIVCLNRTKYNQLWEELGAKVFCLNDKLYTINNKKRKIFNKLYSRIVRLPFIFFKWYIILLQYYTIKRLVNLIKLYEIDLIHLNNQPLRDLYGIIVAEMTNTRCISHLRSMRSKFVPKGFAKYSDSIIEKYIANSAATSKHWKNLGLNYEKIIIVHNVLEIKNGLNKNDNVIRYINNERKDKKALSCIANFSEAKGHKFLIEAFASLISKDKNYILFLGGKGNGQNEIISLVEKYGIKDNVEFLGYLDNPLSVIERSDILIIPSKSEAFGRVILEAWQVNTPVIATNVGGIPEIIQNNKNGILIDYGNVNELVKAIIALSENKDLYNTLAKNGKVSLEKEYSIKNYINLMNNIYDFHKCLFRSESTTQSRE